MSIIENLKKQYAGKKVLVVGLGLLGAGVGLAQFFAKLGSQVTVTDLKTQEQLKESVEKLQGYPITYRLGGHSIEDFLNAEVIFKAPKMRWDAPEIVAATQKGIPVEMEISFFLRHCPTQVIGITGTRGKSTTAYLIYELLKTTLTHSVHLAGNLPHTSTVALLEKVQEGDTVVLEISSWQLSACHKFKLSPPIAVFTSFYPDHLDYYKSMDEYLYDKKAIYLYQGENDHFVVSKQVAQLITNDSIKSHVLEYDGADFPVQLIHLKGEHNRENAAAALKVAEIFRINRERAATAISSFSGLPQRLQLIRRVSDVTFVNDTTSTTPTATVKAIQALHDKPIVLILGGNTKNLPYEELLTALEKVSYIVVLGGTFTNSIMEKLQGRYASKISSPFDEVSQAVKHSFAKAKEIGDSYVLFSPAATSFGMFQNEFHRGDEFNRIVGEL